MRLGATKIRYVIHFSSHREGDFEFLSHNQSKWSTSLFKVRKEVKELIEDYRHNFEPPLSKKQALEELGKPAIYQLSVEEVL